jgi:hypothetical protein
VSDAIQPKGSARKKGKKNYYFFLKIRIKNLGRNLFFFSFGVCCFE